MFVVDHLGFAFQFVDGRQDLPNLVDFRFAARAFLNIYSRVARPGHFVDSMTASILPRFAKVVIANFHQVVITDIRWISAHFRNETLYP
jgi:hypothetical protein